jgi:chromate transporter
MDAAVLLQLMLDFSIISLLSIGGGVTTIPEMHRNVVERDSWMSGAQFSELYAIAQAAPGPTTTMFAALLGWKLAGPLGALVATTSILAPSCLLCYFSATTWERFRNAPWHEMVQAGLVPVTIGLLFAAAWLVGSGAIHTWKALAVSAAAAALMMVTRLNPLWFIAGGAMAGVLGFV